MIVEWRKTLARASAAQIIALAMIVLGAACRISIYGRNPSLWNDEIYLALNIATRNMAALLTKLDLHQSAPIGFLWLERLSVTMFGVNEYSLRLLPLLFGLTALPLSWYVARRYVSDAGALLVTSAVAFSSCAIIYSTSVKQYGIDLFVTLVLLFANSRRRRPALWALAGTFALLLSMPSMFVLAGIWIDEAILALRRKASKSFWAAWLCTGGCWGVVFCSLLAFVYAPVANESFMRRYWAPALFQAQPNLAAIAKLILRSTLGAVFGLHVGAGLAAEGGIFPLALFVVTAALFLIGLFRAPLTVTISFLAPVIATVLGKWVFADRLMLYFVPLAALAIASATDWLFSFLPWNRFYLLSILLLAVFPAKCSLWVVRHPEREALRETVNFVTSRMPASGSVYCYSRGAPAWIFYTTAWRSPDLDRVRWFFDVLRSMDPQEGVDEPRVRNLNGPGSSRQWHGGWEIIGVPDSTSISITGGSASHPDDGWVEYEYRRIRLRARNSIVLVGIAFGARSFPDLKQRFIAGGAKLRDEWSVGNASAVFLELPPVFPLGR